MALIILIVLAFWGGSVMYALLYAREHLSEEALAEGSAHSQRQQVTGRLIAFGAATVGILSVGGMTSAIAGPAKGALWPIIGVALVACAVPLTLPAGKLLGVKLTAERLVGASMALTMVTAVGLAIYFMVRIFLSNPEILG
ncbi:MAG: hypothetical protein EXR67_05475 [Dehalococcoidia bacterium]|nr:hypothetical protein [Dehalococcoidia bacterium]